MNSDVGDSAACFAADVTRAGLDPLTGRTLSFNHVPIAAWAGHLCDLLMAGVIVSTGEVVSAGPATATLHPLVEEAWQHLAPTLPRPWRLAFAPQVIDINKSVAITRRWLVDAGMWSRRRTLFGPRYTTTTASTPSGLPNVAGSPELRHAVLQRLISIARYGASDSDLTVRGGSEPQGQVLQALNTVLSTTQRLIASKAGRPLVQGGGML